MSVVHKAGADVRDTDLRCKAGALQPCKVECKVYLGRLALLKAGRVDSRLRVTAARKRSILEPTAPPGSESLKQLQLPACAQATAAAVAAGTGRLLRCTDECCSTAAITHGQAVQAQGTSYAAQMARHCWLGKMEVSYRAAV